MMLSWSLSPVETLRSQPRDSLMPLRKLKENDRVTGRTEFETQFHILMFCALKVHLYDKQASVLAFGIF